MPPTPEKTFYCSQCGQQNRETDPLCSACAAELSPLADVTMRWPICPHCWTPNPTLEPLCRGCSKEIPMVPNDPERLLFCSHCGSRNRNPGVYCRTCGAMLDWTPVLHCATQTSPSPVPQQTMVVVWRRLGAVAIDGVILFIPTFLVIGVSPDSLALPILFGFPMFYNIILELTGWNGTIGKKALGLIVVGSDGRPLPAGKVIIRNVAKTLSACLPFLYLLVFITAKRQMLHDMIVDASVVGR